MKVVTKFLEWVSVLLIPVIRGGLNRLLAKGVCQIRVTNQHEYGYHVEIVKLGEPDEVMVDTNVKAEKEE